MKNELGRKITSLTLMAIMLGWGITMAGPLAVPEAAAYGDNTSGALSVSSTHIQGGAILGIYIDDSSISATNTSVTAPSVSLGGNSVQMNQLGDGTWAAYVVDESTVEGYMLNTANTYDHVASNSAGFDYGMYCKNGLSATGTTTLSEIIDVEVFASLPTHSSDLDLYCTDVDNRQTTNADEHQMSFLASPPAINTDSSAGSFGQQGHKINGTTGSGSWPYIQANLDFQGQQDVCYGNDCITIYYGNTDDETSISITNLQPSESAALIITITDPGMNWDPTTADVWQLDLYGSAVGSSWPDNETFAWAGNNTGESLAGQMVGGNSNNDGNNQVVNNDENDLADFGCGDNCVLSTSVDPSSYLSGYANVTMRETGASTGVFDIEGLSTLKGVGADQAITFSYGGNSETIITTYNTATASLSAGDTWLPAEAATYTLTDQDLNKDPTEAESLEIGDPNAIIPTIIIGSPLTLYDFGTMGAGCGSTCVGTSGTAGQITLGTGTDSSGATDGYYNIVSATNTTDNSKRLRIVADDLDGEQSTNTTHWLNITMAEGTDWNYEDVRQLAGTPYLQYDVSAIADQLNANDINIYVSTIDSTSNWNGTVIAAGDTNGDMTQDQAIIDVQTSGNTAVGIADLQEGGSGEGLFNEGSIDTWRGENKDSVKFAFEFTHAADADLCANFNDNTGIGATETSGSFSPKLGDDCEVDIAVSVDIVNWDQNNASAVHNGIYRILAEETGENTGVFEGSVNYAYLNKATQSLGVHNGSDQNGPEGIVTFNDRDVTVLLHSEITGASAPRVNYNDTDAARAAATVGAQADTIVHTSMVEFDEISYGVGDMATITVTDPDMNQDNSLRETYTNSSKTFQVTTAGTGSHGQTVGGNIVLVETSTDSSVFVGTFTVQDKLGADLEVEVFDSLDSTNAAVSVFATSTIASSTGSIALDRTVYPVPFEDNKLNEGDNTQFTSTVGEVTLTIAVTEPDHTSDTLCAQASTATCTTSGTNTGTATIKIDTTKIATFGGDVATSATSTAVAELGPLSETEQGSQVYEVEATIGGAASDATQTTSGNNTPINSTSILQVAYQDAADSSGTNNTTVFDSATFDLRTGTLSTDKDVYVLGQDMVVTLTDPDLNLNSASSESYGMGLIQWDSDANSNILLSTTATFTSNPSTLSETGDDTGVFQTVVTIPTKISGTAIEAGEVVLLTYRDVGLSGEKKVQDDELDIETSWTVSDFGAIVELDKAVYDWTDTVAVTITAPDHNTNSNAEESIGTSALPVNANTRAGKMCTGTTSYTLDESSEDTGVFEGSITLTGFAHTMASSDSYTPVANSCSGATSGKLKTAGNMDGVTVSFEWKDNSVALASAIVQWNIGVVEFLDSAVNAGGSSVIRVTDVDEDKDSEVVDTFKVDVYSDSDSGGFTVTVSETDEDTGVFEGTVHFTADAATSGTNLRVSEGDTVTAEYTDVTLPGPDYTTSDDLTIAATTTVGTSTPPLERAPAANARVVDAFGSSVAEVSVDQQVQIAADVANSQDKDQSFAYLVQVQDGNGVTVSLAWITGSLTAGQSMSPALSWTPSDSGSYTATVFVWESVDNPTALSPTVSVSIDVV